MLTLVAACGRGVPATGAAFLLEAARVHGEADVIVLPGERISYAALAAGARRWARLLVGLSVQRGEHVGILLPNGTEYMQVLFGAMLAGAVAVPINARFSAREMGGLIADADLVTIVTSGDEALGFASRLHEALPGVAAAADPLRLRIGAAPRLRNIHAVGPGRIAGFTGAAPGARAGAHGVAADEEIANRQLEVAPEDTALILYTSGSTSRPKGCLLSHRAILTQGRLLAERYHMTAADRIWAPLPMFHVGGISPLVAIAWAGGAFLSMQRFEAAAALEMLAGERVTIAYVLFQTLITDLLNHPSFGASDLSAIRLMISNLAMQPPWLRAQIVAQVPGAVQLGTYGMTESVGAACCHHPEDPPGNRFDRLGAPLPGVQARIVDESGRDLPPGAIGEVLLRGPTIAGGYYRDPDKTALALRDGWFHSGDRGSLDARGSIMFHGRLKDVLKVGGENVGALEVELVVGMHPAVQCCAVIGAPHERLVEVPVAYVELRPGARATPQEITRFCADRLASFKVPRSVYFLDRWPMNATKIDKLELKRRLPPASASGP